MVSFGRMAISHGIAESAITGAVDFLKAHDAEVTQREYINAHRDVLIRAFDNQRDILLAYFEKRFSERRETLEQFYEMLNTAVREKNEKLLHSSLAGILGVIKDNPLSDLAEFRLMWTETNKNIDL